MEPHGSSMGGRRRSKGRSLEGHGRSWRGSGSSVGGQGGVIGDHLEVRCSLPKAMSISRSEILRKKEKKADQKMKSCPRKRFLNLLDRDISKSEKGSLAAAKIGTQNDMWGIFCISPILMISIFAACLIKSKGHHPKIKRLFFIVFIKSL